MASLPYATTSKLHEMLRDSPFPEDIHPGNVFRMLALAPPTEAAALGLIYSVLTETELGPALREMAILRVAQRRRCTADHAGWPVRRRPVRPGARAAACAADPGQDRPARPGCQRG